MRSSGGKDCDIMAFERFANQTKEAIARSQQMVRYCQHGERGCQMGELWGALVGSSKASIRAAAPAQAAPNANVA